MPGGRIEDFLLGGRSMVKRLKAYRMRSRGIFPRHVEGMLRRTRAAGLRALREVASLPLRTLGKTQRGQALEKLAAAMVSEVPISEGTVRFMTPTPLLQARVAAALSKEPDTISWIDSFDSGDVFWDVGANVGVFSLYAARHCGVRVVAFEPSADNYMVLCKNIEMNDLGDRVVPYCIALAGNTELGVLNSPIRQMGAALHQFGERGRTSPYWNGGNTVFAQGMVGFTIDDFIRLFRSPFPTRLKLDVDGLEWSILQGAKQTLRHPRLQSVMAELPVSDRAERDRVIAWMTEAGFDVISCGEIQESGGASAANHFFAKRQALI
jgi:FkbM family methyltransferase